MFLSLPIGVLMDRLGTRKITLFCGVVRLVRGSNTDRTTGHGRGAPSRAVHILRPARFDNRADARRRGVGFWRHLLSYLTGLVWGGVLIVALLCTPEAEFVASPHEEGAARARFRARDMWPRLSDYWASLMLLAIQAIALSLAIMAMRNSTYSVQTSVYVVYLRQLGLVGSKRPAEAAFRHCWG
jgi:hypothetical protein